MRCVAVGIFNLQVRVIWSWFIDLDEMLHANNLDSMLIYLSLSFQVAEYESTTFSIFYNNALFLALVIIASFYILSVSVTADTRGHSKVLITTRHCCRAPPPTSTTFSASACPAASSPSSPPGLRAKECYLWSHSSESRNSLYKHFNMIQHNKESHSCCLFNKSEMISEDHKMSSRCRKPDTQCAVCLSASASHIMSLIVNMHND